MKIRLPIATMGCLLLLSLTAYAQSSEQLLEQGVEAYNAARTYMEGFDHKTVTPENIADMKNRMEKGVNLLDQVIRIGNADQIKAARYFRGNFKYQYGFVLGMKGENLLAFDVFKEIEPDFTALNQADFPLRYVYFGKNFIINWDNFAHTQAEYYTGLGEIAYNLGKYEDALRILRLGIAHPNTSPWLRYVGYNKMLDIADKNPQLINLGELQDLALKALKSFHELDETFHKSIEENNYPKVKRNVDILLNGARKSRTSLTVVRCAEAAPIAARYEPANVKILQLFELCYQSRETGDQTFHTLAADYAQNAKSADPQLAEYVGISATDYLAKSVLPGDCEGLKALADRYGAWNKTAHQAEFLGKSEACQDTRKKAEKKAARLAKSDSRLGSGFNLFLGVHVLPLINSNPKRDYGGAVDFVFGRTALGFSYTKINQNKENIFDLWLAEVEGARQDNLSRWDGFCAFVQPKFLAKEGSNLDSYIGVILGYTEKKFDPLTVNATHDLDGAVMPATFQPVVTQYTGMVNFGLLGLSKGFGMDVSWGIGAHYSRFDPGTTIDRAAYTIDNPLLEYRKDQYFSFAMRLGLTIGLNLGSGIR